MLRRPHTTGLRLAALAALFAVIGVTAAAAGVIVPQRPASFAATFEARAVGDPSVESCPALGPEGQKIEGRYRGTMSIDGEEYFFNFTTLEILVDRATGVGTAEGTWQLVVPDAPELVGRGELLAVVTADPPIESDPPSELQLHGITDGTIASSDREMPAQRLLGNFSASLGDGATFPHLKGTVGDPSVGDPSVGDPSSPAALVPAVKC